MKLTVIVPARNEEECLPHVLKELCAAMPEADVLVVDGYSTDRTAAVAKESGARVVTQEGGPGYGNGVMTGLRHARGEAVCFFDADGSYDPAALPALMSLVRGGCDAAFCSRYAPGAGSDDDTWIRLLGNKIFTYLMRGLFGVRLSDSLFLYCVARKSTFEKVAMRSHGFDWCIEFPIRLHRAGLKYAEIPLRERPRIAGESKVNAFVDGLKILAALARLKREL